MPYPYVPGTPASLKAFVEAVDEAITKYGFHNKKAMRGWLGSPDYHFYTRMKDAETSTSTSSQNPEPNLANQDEVMAERDEGKDRQRPVPSGDKHDQPTQSAATQAVCAKSPVNEDTPSDSSRIATLADIERFRADFERRLEKLEAKALGRSPSAYSAENPVPECPAERQKPLDALSKAPVIGSESGEGSHGSHGSDDSDDYDSNDSSDNEPEEDCVHGRGHDVYCGGCMASRDDSDG